MRTVRALAIFELGLGRDVVANGTLAVVAILEVGDAIVPILAFKATEIGTGYETCLGSNFELGLKGERVVPLLIAGRYAAIHEKQGKRTSPFRQTAIATGRLDGSNGKSNLEAAAVRHVVLDGLLCSLGDSERELLFAWRPLPLGGPAVTVIRFLEFVVSPANSDPEFLRVRGYEQAQADGGWQIRSASASRFWRGSVVEAPGVADFIQFFVTGFFGFLVFVRVDGDEKAGEIPTRRGLGQCLSGIAKLTIRSDKVETQGVDKLFANFLGRHAAPFHR